MTPRIARALRHRNYRLFFAGQSVSLVGTWITRVATSWLVYRLTGSVLLLGLVGFCGQLPTLLLAPFAGVLVDRWDRHRILVVTQLLSLVQSAALAALTLGGGITVPLVLGLQIAQGIINAFDTPARQAFVVQMVEDRADLPNAIALNSSMVNGSRIIGPSNTILQTLVEERLRGRVMSFYTMAFLGTAPIGSLLAGVLADRLGAPTAVLVGVACLLAGLWFATRLPALRALVRPLYVERGILAAPDLDPGTKSL